MRHWTDDELIDSIYGIGPVDGHLESCAECRGRRSRLEWRRLDATVAVEPSASRLAAQRRAVYERAGSHRWPGWARAVAAPAAVGALAVTLMVSRPAPPVRVETATVDPQLFADAWAAAVTEEPRAAEPIHALFEEAQ